MTAQMNLLGPQPTAGVVEVPVCPDVLRRGAEACADGSSGPQLFPHRHVPAMPRKVADEHGWLTALDFAEDARRYNQAGRARLDLSRRAGASPCGVCGPNQIRLSASSRGIEIGDYPAEQIATWPQLLAARTEQRGIEVEVANARDLAEGYHYLDYYGHVYTDLPWSEGWSPIPLIRRLAEEVRDLGGDPSQLTPRSDYMREALGS
jgi:hypothetical protein